ASLYQVAFYVTGIGAARKMLWRVKWPSRSPLFQALRENASWCLLCHSRRFSPIILIVPDRHPTSQAIGSTLVCTRVLDTVTSDERGVTSEQCGVPMRKALRHVSAYST